MDYYIDIDINMDIIFRARAKESTGYLLKSVSTYICISLYMRQKTQSYTHYFSIQYSVQHRAQLVHSMLDSDISSRVDISTEIMHQKS